MYFAFTDIVPFKIWVLVFLLGLSCALFALVLVCLVWPRLWKPIWIAVGLLWAGWMVVTNTVITGVFLFVFGVFFVIAVLVVSLGGSMSPETSTSLFSRRWYLELAGGVAASAVGAVMGLPTIVGGGAFLFLLGVGIVVTSLVVGVGRTLRAGKTRTSPRLPWCHWLGGGVAACVIGALVFVNPWFLEQGGDRLEVWHNATVAALSKGWIPGGREVHDPPFEVTLNPHHGLTDVSGSVILYYSDGTSKSQDFLFAEWVYGEAKTIGFKFADRGFEKMAIRMVGRSPSVGNKIEYKVDLLKTDFIHDHHRPYRPAPP
jgi:hypothetical protein